MSNTNIIAEHNHHIDNGGVSFIIEDRGSESGWFLIISTQYFGAIKTELELGSNFGYLGPEWLQKIGLMFLSASEKLKHDRQTIEDKKM